MAVWEVDFYRRPLQDEGGNPLWELLVCDPAGEFRHSALCPQSQATGDWLIAEMQQLADLGHPLPNILRVFRPQTFNLLQTVAEKLGIAIEPTRHTPTLKCWLEERARQYPTLPNYTGQSYQPLHLDQPPPVPLAETLWGDRWGFTSLPAADLVEAFRDRPIPILEMPEDWFPLKLGIASTLPIPGVVITGGRRSMMIARWLQESHPYSLNYVPGAPDGLILEAGLCDRWIVATFADPDVKAAAQQYEQRKRQSKELHFLLVQPDDSGITYSGFWLLRGEGQ
jgi:hypothetical protein